MTRWPVGGQVTVRKRCSEACRFTRTRVRTKYIAMGDKAHPGEPGVDGGRSDR